MTVQLPDSLKSSEALAARARAGGKPFPGERRRHEAGGEALSREAAASRRADGGAPALVPRARQRYFSPTR
jgi:hypothetical protein